MNGLKKSRATWKLIACDMPIGLDVPDGKNEQGQALWEAVVPQLPGFTVEVLPQIDSTNTELMRRARAGRLEPTLLVAEEQTAGRGRLGRDWHSSAYEGTGVVPALTFSLGLPLAKGLSGMLKIADYRAAGFARDTRKLWLQVEYKGSR